VTDLDRWLAEVQARISASGTLSLKDALDDLACALRIIVRLRRLLLTVTNDIRENARHDPECAMFLGPDERDEDADCDCWVSQALASGEAAIAYDGRE